ncbi:MAG: c-type cytochrome [Solirubrobacteraceae bacterium]
MNQAEKEAYLREYSILKNQGKPFFPYSVAEDSIMAVLVMAMIIFLTLMFGAELGPKANPATTSYTPRPEWYFFFLFEVFRVMRNVPEFTTMAAVGVPGICMVLLFLLPFYDRSPERRIERRPVALLAGVATILAMAYLTYTGATAGSPNEVVMAPPSQLTAAEVTTFNAGKLVVGENGCLACHVIGQNGNNGPGPPLTHIGKMLQPGAIASTIENPTSPMPPFKRYAQQYPKAFNDMVSFLGDLQ